MFTSRSTMTPQGAHAHDPATPLREGFLAADPSVFRDEKRSDAGKNSFSTEMQRVFILMGGGAIGLIFLLLLAQSMNPSDEALRSQDFAAAFAPLDGIWVGQMTQINAKGETVSYFSEHREFLSTSAMVQTANVTRIKRDGASDQSIWVLREQADGSLTYSKAEETSQPSPFVGSVDNGHYFWQREVGDGVEIIRHWVIGNSLLVEEMHIPNSGSPDNFSIISGRLQRMEMVDH